MPALSSWYLKLTVWNPTDGAKFSGYACSGVVGVLYQFAVYRFPCQNPVAVSCANVGI